MKIILTSLVIILLISSSAFGNENHQHDAEERSSHGMQCGMDMISHEQKMAMHKRMEKMKVTMVRIKAEKDLKKRENLTQELVQHMEDCLSLMQNMMEPENAGHEHRGS